MYSMNHGYTPVGSSCVSVYMLMYVFMLPLDWPMIGLVSHTELSTYLLSISWPLCTRVQCGR